MTSIFNLIRSPNKHNKMIAGLMGFLVISILTILTANIVKHNTKQENQILTNAQTSSLYTRVFYDDFESGVPQGWANTDISTCPVVKKAVDGGLPEQGIYMAQCGWNGTVAWNDPEAMKTLVLSDWSYSKEMFFRLWLRLDQDMDNKDGEKLFRVGFEGECGNMIQRDPVTQNGGTHEGWTCGPNKEVIMINAWGPHNFEDRKWHKFEIYIKHDSNGADGEIKTWEDGVLTVAGGSKGYPYKGKTTWSSNTRWTPFIISSNWSSNPGWEHDAANHWYVDSVEVFSDSSTGITATGNLSDASVTVSNESLNPSSKPSPSSAAFPTASSANSPEPTSVYVTPTVYCLGACPTDSITPTTNAPSPTMQQDNTSPTKELPSNTPISSTAPSSSASQSSSSGSPEEASQTQGLIKMIIALIIFILNFLLKLLGM